MEPADAGGRLIQFPRRLDDSEPTDVETQNDISVDIAVDISPVIPIRSCLDCDWVMIGNLGEWCGVFKEEIVTPDWAMDCEEYQ